MFKAWEGFKGDAWKNSINVRSFIQENYNPYEGDDSFLEGATEASTKLWTKLTEMFKVELKKGIYDAETKIPSAVDAYGAGYIEKARLVVHEYGGLLPCGNSHISSRHRQRCN